MANKEFMECDGKKIRVQYFNIVLYLVGSVFFMVYLLAPFTEVVINFGFDMGRYREIFFGYLTDTIIVVIVFMGPVLLLSVLNRFLFGKTVAVAGEDALILENQEVAWHDIKEIEYTPNNLNKYHKKPCIAIIGLTNGKRVGISHFPLYGVRLIKKHNPDVKFTFSKEGKRTIAGVILAVIVGGILFPFI